MAEIYLASPLGFAASTESFMLRIEQLLKAEGFEVANPWRNPVGQEVPDAREISEEERRILALKALNNAIAERNEADIRRCDLVLAVLDGVDVDSGTASEIGFAYALGKPVLGLRTDFRLAGENEAATVNLQVQYWIEAGGGDIARSLDDLGDMLRAVLR